LWYKNNRDRIGNDNERIKTSRSFGLLPETERKPQKTEKMQTFEI
jgi:hypothetical protein